MSYNPDVHHRHSIRLQGYDYTCDGFYFVTICVHNYRPLFGSIQDGIMTLSDAGEIIEDEFARLTERYPHIICHEHIVMPNHFHAIIQIKDNVGASLADAQNETGHPQGAPLQKITLGQIIGAFKSITTHRCIQLYNKYGKHLGKVWQRNYYEHIIRNQRSYDEITRYIIENPIHWHNNKLYLAQ